MRNRLRGKDSVIVTGASRGLGLEIALTLAQRGFRVWAGVRDDPGRLHAEQEAQRRGVSIVPVVLDVTDPLTISQAIDEVTASGPLHALVNNAGITLRGFFEDMTDAEIRQIFEVNCFGAMNVTREVLPHLRAAGGGRVILVSSIGGRIGSAAVSGYVASKFALEGFAESLSLEVRPFEIHVSVIEPGIVRTDIWDSEKRVCQGARSSTSPYSHLFWKGEELVEKLLGSSRLRTTDVAESVYRTLTARSPRLRYVVGRRARAVVRLRKLLPGELFERFYFGAVVKRLSQGTSSGQ